MAATATLLSDISDHLAALPNDDVNPEDFRRHFTAWARPLLAGDLNLQKRQWNPHEVISEDALAALASFGYLLSALKVEPSINESSVQGILSQFDALIVQVSEADDLDPDMRAFLVRHLTNLAERLRLVRIYGRPGIDEATGRFMIEVGQIKKNVEQEPKSRLARFVRSESFQACMKLLDGLLKVVGATTAIVSIAQGFGLFLPHGGQPAGKSGGSEAGALQAGDELAGPVV
jgi:hypothetical protein